MVDADTASSYDVFISHRSTKGAGLLANELFSKLKERGITAFLDTAQLEAGDYFTEKIIESIRKARVVVVFFDTEMTSWLNFEAACAFFDRKLMPVAIDGAEVPPPYSRIQHDTIVTSENEELDENALNRVIDLIEHKLLGTPHQAYRTRVFRWLNTFFIWGLWVIAAITGTIVIFGWSSGVATRIHISHLHVVLGAIILGGQFFLALAFARAVRSPSFREREYGFETTEKLFWVWLVFAVLQPLLGIWLLFNARPTGQELLSNLPPYIVASMALYPAAVVFTLVGYVVARGARELDRQSDAPSRVDGRYFLANVLFFIGFVVAAWVVNLMIAKRLPEWPF